MGEFDLAGGEARPQFAPARDETGGKMLAQLALAERRQRRETLVQRRPRPGIETPPGGVARDIGQGQLQGLPAEPPVGSEPGGVPRRQLFAYLSPTNCRA